MMEGAQDMAKDRPAKRADRSIQKITPEDLPRFYVNNVQMKVTLFDFVLQLGMMVDATEEKLVVMDMATVFMSPQHTKALAKLLSEHVATYEAKFGPIPEHRGSTTDYP